MALKPHHWVIVAQFDAGEHRIEKLALAHGYSVAGIRNILIRAGRALSDMKDGRADPEFRARLRAAVQRGWDKRKGREQTDDHRNADIIAMRRAGCSLRIIGEKYDLSRERVRQILLMSGEGGLTGWRVKRGEQVPRQDRTCPQCGGLFRCTEKSKRRYCSRKCFADALKTMPDQEAIAMVRAVIVRRKNGASWKDCAREHGFDDSVNGVWRFATNISNYARRFGLAIDLATVKNWSAQQRKLAGERSRIRWAHRRGQAA